MFDFINKLYRGFKGPRSSKDTTWSWMVVVAGFTINMCTCGFQMTFGLVYTSLLRDFKEDKGKTALAGSLMTCLMFLCAPLSSIVSDRVGIRISVLIGSLFLSISLLLTSFVNSLTMMYITFGVMAGIAAAFLATPCNQAVNQYFEKRTTIALALVSTGIPFASIALAPIYAWILQAKGWRYLFRALSLGIGVITTVAGCTFVPTRNEIDEKKKLQQLRGIEKFRKYRQILKNPRFVTLLAAIVTGAFAVNNFNVHLVEFSLEYGIPWEKASMLPTIIGAGSIVGRTIAGILHSYRLISPVKFYQWMSLILGIISLLLSRTTSYPVIATLIFLHMVADGASLGVQGIPTIEVSGPNYFLQAWALTSGLQSIGLFLGPPIAGWIVDATGDYKSLMYWTSVPFFLVILILLPFHFNKFGSNVGRNLDNVIVEVDSEYWTKHSKEQECILERETCI